MYALTEQQKSIHESALRLSRRHRELESEIIVVLQLVEDSKLFAIFGKSSLFAYAFEVLGFSESVAYCFISVARKSRAVPELHQAIASGTLTASKASRMVPVLTKENSAQLIEFASQHTSREIDFEVARLNPKTACRDSFKPVSEDAVQVRGRISRKTDEKRKRVQALQAQRGLDESIDAILDAAFECYLDRHDPVRKAERALERGKKVGKRLDKSVVRVDGTERPLPPLSQQERSGLRRPPAAGVIRPVGVEKPPMRKKLTAAENHAVAARDGGRCTHVGLDGKSCNSDRFTQTHHIIPVSQGGTNDVENLTTLCSVHHDLVHQLSLPIDYQVTWLRSKRLAYG